MTLDASTTNEQTPVAGCQQSGPANLAPPSPLAPSKARRGGAPVGNRNRFRTGSRSRQPLMLGKSPPGLHRAVSDARKVVNALLAAVVQARGTATLLDQSLALEAGEYEIQRRACWRLLRQVGPDGKPNLTVEQQLAIRREASRAATERTRCIRALGIDLKPAGDVWASLHSTIDGQHDPEVIPASQDAATESDTMGQGDGQATDQCSHPAGGQAGGPAESKWPP